jgi:hypothetical protein
MVEQDTSNIPIQVRILDKRSYCPIKKKYIWIYIIDLLIIIDNL